jgi:hypothetical protein
MFYKLLTHFGMQYPTEHFRVIISLYKQNWLNSLASVSVIYKSTHPISLHGVVLS